MSTEAVVFDVMDRIARTQRTIASLEDRNAILATVRAEFQHLPGVESVETVSAEALSGEVPALEDPASAVVTLSAIEHGRPVVVVRLTLSDATAFDPFRPLVEGFITLLGSVLGERRPEDSQIPNELRESEARYRHLIEACPDGILLHVDGDVVFVNQAGADLFGVESPDELIGRRVLDFLDEESAKAARARGSVERTFGEKLELAERRIVRPDGSVLDVETGLVATMWKGQPALQEHFREISDRKQAEERLRQSERRWRTLTESSADHIALLDLDYVIQFINRIGSGITKDDVLGKSAFDFVHPSMHNRTIACFEEVVRSGRPDRFESRYVNSDGVTKFFDVRVAPIRNDDGDVIGLITSSNDITEEKKSEEIVRGLERQLQQAQKLESLGVLAGGIAHDFNNILTAVLGHADLVEMDLEDGHPAHAGVRGIQRGILRASELTRQMLAYSGQGALDVQLIDVSEQVREVAQLLRTSVPRTSTLDLRLEDGLAAVRADARQVHQVMMNLVTNAADAIGEAPGTISVATGETICDESLLSRNLVPADPEHPTPSPGVYTWLEVTDTGSGMDEDTAPRIFEPFFTTRTTGRGLGMAALLGIVRSHGGILTMETEVEYGTTFRVYFPAASSHTQALRPGTPAHAPAAEAFDATLLVVDDEEPIRTLASEMLVREGFNVLTAGDGEEALAIFRERAEEIACVFLDLTMPRMNGQRCFQALREIRPDVKVVIMSGFSSASVDESFGSQSPNAFLLKPFSMNTLLERARTVVHGHQTIPTPGGSASSAWTPSGRPRHRKR